MNETIANFTSEDDQPIAGTVAAYGEPGQVEPMVISGLRLAFTVPQLYQTVSEEGIAYLAIWHDFFETEGDAFDGALEATSEGSGELELPDGTFVRIFFEVDEQTGDASIMIDTTNATPGDYSFGTLVPPQPIPLVAPCPYGLTHYGMQPIATQDDVDELADSVEALQSGKQDKLTAGNNITIVDNVISASVPQGARIDQTLRQVSCSKPVTANGIPISLFDIERVTLTGTYFNKPDGRTGSINFLTFVSGDNRTPVIAEGKIGSMGGYSASSIIGHASGSIGGGLSLSFSATGGWPDGWNPKAAVLNGIYCLEHSERLSSGHTVNLSIVFSAVGVDSISPGAYASSSNVLDVWISPGMGYDSDTDWALVEALTSISVASADTISMAGYVHFV